MIPDKKSLGTSGIGGIAETQEAIDICSKHNIVSDIKIISINHINEAFGQVNEGELAFIM